MKQYTFLWWRYSDEEKADNKHERYFKHFSTKCAKLNTALRRMKKHLIDKPIDQNDIHIDYEVACNDTFIAIDEIENNPLGFYFGQ